MSEPAPEPTRRPWRRDFKRHALVAALFVLLAFLGRIGLIPIQLIAAHVPHPHPFSVDAVLATASFAIHSPPGNVPITLVDIDDELYREWGRPCLTPRDRLMELIAAVAARKPRMIVVDISLGCAHDQACCAAGSTEALAAFFRDYAGPTPLILVREMHVERTRPSGERNVIVDATPFDAAIEQNPHISWGHTFYVTDSDGAVRSWREHWEACQVGAADESTEAIVSVPSRVLSLLNAGSSEAPELPARTGNCELEKQPGPLHVLLLGPRVIGVGAERRESGAIRRVPARLIADPTRAVDEQGYYSLAGRVVVLGASHSSSEDKWRTSLGYIPGMELVAHTIRFSGAQMDSSEHSYWRWVFQVVTAFLLLTVISFFLRPLAATITSVVTIVAFATICASWFGWLDIFEALEDAIWLFAGYHLLLALIHFVKDAGRYPRLRKARALLAERIRKGDPECKPRE